MKNIIEDYWKILQKKLPEEQVFYIFIIMTFTAYQNIRRGAGTSYVFSESSFKEAFEDIRYDTKEAAFRLAEKGEWPLLTAEREIHECIQCAYKEIYQFLSETNVCRNRHFGLLVECIVELSSSDTAGGYIATPPSIRRLIAELLREVSCKNIADFCCGIAILGTSICMNMIHNMSEKADESDHDDIGRDKSEETASVFLDGAELDPTLCMIGNILRELQGIPGMIIQKDILAPIGEAAISRYDLILLDIPRGSNKRENYDARDPRWKEFVQKTVYTDWLFIQDALYQLMDGGYMVVLCTNGVLIRANESSLRKRIIEKDWLEAVISLPANLYPDTRTGTELLVFRKGKSKERRQKILFADISQYYFREKRNAYAVTQEGIEAACASFVGYKEIEGVSVIRSGDELDDRICTWKPVQYICREQDKAESSSIELAAIATIVRGAQLVKKDETKADAHVGGGDDMEHGKAYLINIRDIQDGMVIYDTAERINDTNSACKEKYRIQEDDILLTSKGTAIKIAAVMKDPPLAYISGNITLIRVDRQAYDPYILFYYLDSAQGRAALNQIQSGTTIRILNNANLSRLRVPSYDIGKMREVGRQLKVKREVFREEYKALLEKYDTERKALLDLLKED